VEAALIAALPRPGATAAQARGLLESLVGEQLPRLERAGIRARAAVGLPPSGLPRRGLHEVLQSLPDAFARGRAAALGPLGIERADDVELEALDEQLGLARELELPVLVMAPRAPQLKGLVSRLQASRVPPRRILVSGLTVAGARVVLGCGFHAGLALHPDVQRTETAVRAVHGLGARRLVLTGHVGLSAGDLLALPRAAHLLARSGLSEAVVNRVTAVNLAAWLRVPQV